MGDVRSRSQGVPGMSKRDQGPQSDRTYPNEAVEEGCAQGAAGILTAGLDGFDRCAPGLRGVQEVRIDMCRADSADMRASSTS